MPIAGEEGPHGGLRETGGPRGGVLSSTREDGGVVVVAGQPVGSQMWSQRVMLWVPVATGQKLGGAR